MQVKFIHTRHWQHLNRLGKEYIIQEMSKTVDNYKTVSSTEVVLGFETNTMQYKSMQKQFQQYWNSYAQSVTTQH
jgi:hypothetical protein